MLPLPPDLGRRLPRLLFGLLLSSLLLLGGCGDSLPGTSPETARQDPPVAVSAESPIIHLWSNVLGNWTSGTPSGSREVFAGNGVRFEWNAVPGPSGSPVLGYSFAVDDTSEWSPLGLDNTEFPPSTMGEPNFWFPEAGSHAFFVRAVAQDGATTVLAADFTVFPGPLFCPVQDRFILVVLDTDPGALIAEGIWPADYADVERALVDEWFAGYDYQIHETGGSVAPSVSLMNCASSTFWFHGADLAKGAVSVLKKQHTRAPNVVASYNASGGNVFLCGIQPSQALRWFESTADGIPVIQDYPIDFGHTLDSPDWRPHWATTRLGVAEIERSIGGARVVHAKLPRIAMATSCIDGPNPYPDLPRDPSRWPRRERGFGYFDFGVSRWWDSEVIYKLADSDTGIGVRRLAFPGVSGNAVFLGFHPYFVEDAAFLSLIAAVMADFGEVGTAR